MESKIQDSATGGQDGMRIFHVLDRIENAISHSRQVIFTDYVLVNKDKIIKLIEKTRSELPKEMKQARWVSQENQRIIQEAQRKAGDIIRESERRSEELLKAAQEESRKRLDKEQIVQQAKSRAEEILTGAQSEAERLLTDAKQRSADTLRTSENQASDMLRKAKTEAEYTRAGADDYALKILNNLEVEFTRMLASVQKSKRALEEASSQQSARTGSAHTPQEDGKYETSEIANASQAERLPRPSMLSKPGVNQGKPGLSKK